MPNVFDQFDAPQGGGNVFDQFDAPAPTTPSKPSWDWGQVGSMAINDILNLPRNIYGAFKDAVTLPGDVTYGQAQVPQSANFPALPGQRGGEDTSQLGNVVNLAGMGVRPATGTFGKTVGPTEAQLEAAKNAQYSGAESIPIEVHPTGMGLVRQAIKNYLGIDPALAPTTFKVLDGDYFNKPGTVSNLRVIQRSLGEVKNDYNTTKTERTAAGRALYSFNQFLESMDQYPSALTKGTPEQAAEFSSLIKQANGNNTALELSRDFTKRGNDALIEANAANSGMNAEGRLNAKVAQVLKNPKLQRGMDTDTIDALKDYNGGSRTSNTMRLVSNALGGGGGLGMVAAEGLGQVFGIPAGVLPGIGITLKSLGNKAAFNKFGQIGNQIRANSPLARAGEVSFNGGGLLGRPRITIPLSPQNTSQE